MKVFVIVRDLLAWPKAIVERVAAEGHEPQILSMGSTYPPLIDWLKTQPHRVVWLENLGHHGPWRSGVVDAEVKSGEFYAVTDPDLDLSGVPQGFLEFLRSGLERFPWATKAGLSLEWEDLPEKVPGVLARGWERRFWDSPLDGDFYRADTDTTTAVYLMGRGSPMYCGSSIRARRPFTARHLPWYFGPGEMPDDYRYYVEHLDGDRPLTWTAFHRKAHFEAKRS